jgi:defect in organelle trafficking protein DotC
MNIKTLIVIPCFALTLTGCAHKTPTVPPAQVGFISTASLQQSIDTAGMGSIRMQALRSTAAELGTQGGLAWRAEHIDQSLGKQSDYLDHVFDFNQLLLKNNVIPPVLAQTGNTINLTGDDAIRLADKTYQIISPARFTSAPPTWRTYLWLSFKKPDAPNHTLLPRNAQEVAYWNMFIQSGWKKGLEQANDIFSANLARLKRDYTGMVLYHTLLDEHIVSAPFVAKSNLGVTGDGNQLRVNDQVLRITANSRLQTNGSDWRPVLTH